LRNDLSTAWISRWLRRERADMPTCRSNAILEETQVFIGGQYFGFTYYLTKWPYVSTVSSNAWHFLEAEENMLSPLKTEGNTGRGYFEVKPSGLDRTTPTGVLLVVKFGSTLALSSAALGKGQ
jgi:hypothetical protein